MKKIISINRNNYIIQLKKFALRASGEPYDGQAFLSHLMSKPSRLCWKEIIGDIGGLKDIYLGITKNKGLLTISLGDRYKILFVRKDFRQKGYAISIEKMWIEGEVLNLNIQWEKGVDKFSKRFQLGNHTITLQRRGKGGRAYRTFLKLSDDFGKLVLPAVAQKPINYDWDNAYKKGELLLVPGLYLGKTVLGDISYTPFLMQKRTLNIIKIKDSISRDVYVEHVRVEKHLLTFTVKAVTPREPDVFRIFQVGQVAETYGGDQRGLIISDQLGRVALGQLILFSEDTKWMKAKLPIMDGFRIGESDKKGLFSLSPLKRTTYTGLKTGVIGRVSGAKIVELRRKDNFIEVDIAFKRDGVREIVTHQMSRFKDTLRHKNGQIEKSRTLKLSHFLGLTAIKLLIKKPLNEPWIDQDVKDLIGLKLGRVDRNGYFRFSVYPGEQYYWQVLPRGDVQPEGIISDINLDGDQLNIDITYSYQDRKTVVRYVITNKPKTLYTKRGKDPGFARVIEERTYNWLLEKTLMADNLEDRYVYLKKLEGEFLGETNHDGVLSLIPSPNTIYKWSVIGKAEGGWSVFLEKVWQEHVVINLQLRLEKVGEISRTRRFQVGDENRKLKIKGSNQYQSVANISRSLGLSSFKDLMVIHPKEDFDSDRRKSLLKQLDGLHLGETGSDGRFSMFVKRFIKVSFRFQVKGKMDVFVTRTSANSNYFEIEFSLESKGFSEIQTYYLLPIKKSYSSKKGSHKVQEVYQLEQKYVVQQSLLDIFNND